MYEKIKKWYKQGLWSAEQVQKAVDKGVITAEQAEEILSQE
jgi:uncharacterized XkdX family phage protein